MSHDIRVYSPNEDLVSPSYGSFNELVNDSDTFLSAGKHFFQLTLLLIFVCNKQVLLVTEPEVEDVIGQGVNDLSLVISDLIFNSD